MENPEGKAKMKKKLWKRILVMYCVGNFLMTSVCGPVFAEGMQEGMVEFETEKGD